VRSTALAFARSMISVGSPMSFPRRTWNRKKSWRMDRFLLYVRSALDAPRRSVDSIGRVGEGEQLHLRQRAAHAHSVEALLGAVRLVDRTMTLSRSASLAVCSSNFWTVM
jgi:hypothetical protein